MKLKTNIAVLGSLLMASTFASAAVVTFSSADYLSSLISNEGTLVGALNGTIGGDVTVNNVTYTGHTAATNNTGAVTFAGGQSILIFGGANTVDSANGTAGALTSDGFFNSAGNGAINFTGLTSGQDYLIQFTFSDNRANLSGGTSGDVFNLWGNGDGSGSADFTTVDVLNDAQLVTGRFTASGTTQDFYIDQQTNVGTFDGFFGSMQLRAVPEPSSTALLGLGGLALIMRRRK